MDCTTNIEDSPSCASEQPVARRLSRARSCSYCTTPASTSVMGKALSHLSSQALSHLSSQGLEVFDTPAFVQGAQRAKPFVSPITTSVFELFKIGIGPSSSHTVGPMVACRNFSKNLVVDNLLPHVESVIVELRGSLALTGIGHGTNKAVVLGLSGVAPAEVEPTTIESFLATVAEQGTLHIGFQDTFKEIKFVEERDVLLVSEELPLHPNAMICQAFSADGDCLKEIRYYSTGGGFVLNEDEMVAAEKQGAVSRANPPPLPFLSMSDLVRVAEEHELDIAGVMRRNEEARRSPEDVENGLQELWAVMEQCVERGLQSQLKDKDLPGPMGLIRRAPGLYAHAQKEKRAAQSSSRCSSGCFAPLKRLCRTNDRQNRSVELMDELRWLDCYALAVMEENACMGRVVTAPTNGAAGVVPAVLTYYMRHLRPQQPRNQRHKPSTYLLTAAAAGILAKEHACISGAAGGCQAEVGTATAMAAAGLCAVLGGSPKQVEEAAEIALEHSLGMTCDPILGLVQAPCIERNTMGATKAVNAVALVLKSPPSGRRSMLRYDDVLRVMKSTGADMDRRYRETALGGLAADYEKSLTNKPELMEKVHATMGFGRIQQSTKRRLKKEITYQDLTETLSMQRIHSQAQASC